MNINVRRVAEPTEVAVVRVIGDVDVGDQGVDQLRAALDELVESGARYVLIDLTDTTFVVSRGFGQMLVALARLRTRGGDLRVAGASGSVLKAAQTVGLDAILQFHRTPEEGIAGFATT